MQEPIREPLPADSPVERLVPLTAADKDALLRMPDGWFYAEDLPYMVKRPRYRCERLEKMGCLISGMRDNDIFAMQKIFKKA